MNPISGTGYEVIISSILGAVFAQLIKFIINIIIGNGLNFRLLVQTGGMPSSHSALMTAMAYSVGVISGFDSTVFAVALGTAFIVLYDAAGVRRAAGHMAGILNKMTEDFYQHHPEKLPKRLRELLGHTPIEVLVGSCLGILTAYWIHIEMLG